MLRTTVTPGVSMGTRHHRLLAVGRGVHGSVLPITMEIAQWGCMAPEMNHLWPLRTYSSPSRSMVSWMLVASGRRHRRLGHREARPDLALQQRVEPLPSFCSAVPNMVRTSMFPVSGAEQLQASEARGERPMTSASGA